LIVEFLAWDLEKEHRDLGLGTLSNPSEPPLSLFGIAFRATKYGSRGIDWIQKIARYVDGSIMHAKLALDRIHISGSPEAVDLKTKRIPRNVQAHYNVAIRTMGQRTASSTMALKSVAAVGREGETVHGLPLSRLAKLLKERPSRGSPKSLPPRSPEDVIGSANGYLRLVAP
jgi:hypothetical protein